MLALPKWIESALDYNSHGWSVVPIKPFKTNIKVGPLVENWDSLGAGDRRSIKKWRYRWKDASLALVAGRRSGVVVLEVHEDRGGQDIVKRHYAKWSALGSRTPHARTWDGRHFLFFELPLGVVAGDIKLSAGVRLLGEGALVPLPNETRQSNYGRFKWLSPPGMEFPDVLPRSIRKELHLLDRVDADPTPRSQIDERTPTKAPVESHTDPVAAELQPKTGEDYEGKKGRDTVSISLTSASSILGRQDTDWVVSPWAKQGSVTILQGTTKSAGKSAGKTTFALGMSRAVAGGEPFLEASTLQSPVVYLSEQGRASLHAALGSFATSRCRSMEHLYLLSSDAIPGVPFPVLAESIMESAIDIGARLIVIDTIDRFAAINRHGSGFDDPSFLDAICKLRATGLALLLVTHTYKFGSPRLGLLSSVADTVVELIPLTAATGSTQRLRRVRYQSRLRHGFVPPFIEWKRGSIAPVSEVRGSRYTQHDRMLTRLNVATLPHNLVELQRSEAGAS